MWKSFLARLKEPSTQSALGNLGTLATVLTVVFPNNPVVHVIGDVATSVADTAASGGGGEALIGAVAVSVVTSIAGILIPERGSPGASPAARFTARATPIEPGELRG